jgi:hypothetical protein
MNDLSGSAFRGPSSCRMNRGGGDQPASSGKMLLNRCCQRSLRFVSFRASNPQQDCKALPYSHLSCTQYAGPSRRRAGSCFPDSLVVAFSVWPLWGAGRLDWNLQDIALLRKKYVTRVSILSQEKSCPHLSNLEIAGHCLDAALTKMYALFLTLGLSISSGRFPTGVDPDVPPTAAVSVSKLQ